MKKIFITTAMIALLGTSVFANDGDKKNGNISSVSYTVKNQFDSAFSDAKDVSWTISANCQKAVFTLNNKKMTAFYSLQGEYLGVTQDVAYSAIASKAQKQIADKYKDYTINEVIKLETRDSNANFDQTVYFVDLKGLSDELLVRVTPNADVYFFQKIK